MAFRFRKNCERSDGILQRFLNPTEENTLNDDEYIEQPDDGDILLTNSARTSKDSRVVVSSDCGLYEYRPPMGLNVKLVKNDIGTRAVQTTSAAKKVGGAITATTATATPSEHTIYLKSEPLNDDDSLDENDCIDVLYDMDSNFDDSCDATDRTMDPLRNVSTRSIVNVTAANDQNSKLMQIKPVRTNKIRLGYTSSNKGKTLASSTVAKSSTTATAAAASMAASASIVKGKSKENGSKENATTNRSPKSKTNAKGEPKQPKECEICGNTYTYQHALER